jgi:CDP-diglyceride synthetase
MKPPQFSIVKLMVIVGVVALDFAAARILLAYNQEMLIGIALGGLVLQVGFFRLIRSRGRGRAFWVGFIVCGLMAMTTLVWAMRFPEVFGIRGGALIRTPGSPLHTVWYGYAKFVSERIIAPVLYNPRINPGPNRDSVVGGASIVAIRSIVWFLPQILIAIVGGLLTSLIGRRLGKSRSSRPHPQVTSAVSSLAR